MRVYFDACCLNRPYDDQMQDRIRLETEAIRAILGRVAKGDLHWVISSALELELLENPNEDKRAKATEYLSQAAERVTLSPTVAGRVHEFGSVGIRTFDGLHLAFAESATCDVLFTVDDEFMKRSSRLTPPSAVRVVNPLQWLQENPA